jgi:hypothetical protein
MARAEAGSSCYRNIVDQRNKHFKNTCFLLCLGNILLLERRWTRTVAFPGFPAFEPCMQAKADHITFGNAITACGKAKKWDVAIALLQDPCPNRGQTNIASCYDPRFSCMSSFKASPE